MAAISHFHKILFILLCVAFSGGCGNDPTKFESKPTQNIAQPRNAININTADREELAKLPYIGDKIAERIIEHRNANGPFERPEQLMLIQGISDERFRKIRSMVRVE